MLLARILAAAKARAGKNSFPPTPFLFARPSVQFGARSAPSVLFKKGSDFVKQTHKKHGGQVNQARRVRLPYGLQFKLSGSSGWFKLWFAGDENPSGSGCGFRRGPTPLRATLLRQGFVVRAMVKNVSLSLVLHSFSEGGTSLRATLLRQGFVVRAMVKNVSLSLVPHSFSEGGTSLRATSKSLQVY